MNDVSVSLTTIKAAAERIAPRVRITPVLTNDSLDQISGNRLYLKAEHLQKVGAFKFRGAQNAVAQLSPTELERGVTTQSSGNHAQALALAARQHGTRAHIVMPSNAPPPKIAAVQSYGAKITFCQPIVAERERVLRELVEKTQATYVPPYDHPSVISGQGTIGFELLNQVKDLDAIVAPVGGGGLVSGIATAVKSTAPSIRVFGAEPLGADDAARSLAAGRIIPQENPNTIADGLLTSLGQHTFPLIQRFVDDILTVEEGQIVEAMRLVWERTKQVIEPSAAVAVAGALSLPFKKQFSNANVAIVLSGGNVDLEKLPF